MKLIDTNLETFTWITQSGPSVNSVIADSFTGVALPSGVLKVTNVSSKTMGGALVTLKRQPPVINGSYFPYLGMDMDILISSYDMPLLARLELDIKACLQAAPSGQSIRNVFNFSSQINMSTGQWQIDNDPPGWKDTGFKPILTPDKWMHFSFRYFLDIKNSKFSILNVNFDDQPFTVPDAMQGVPLQNTNWGIVTAIQLQTEINQPGALNVLFDNIDLTWSDQKF